MWLYGEWVSAAEAPTQTGVSDQLIIMIGGVVTAAIVALGGVLVAIVNRGGAKTAPSPPGPLVAAGSDHVLYERTAVLTQRADDNDERDDVQDRRLDQIERVLDLDNPEWRRRF